MAHTLTRSTLARSGATPHLGMSKAFIQYGRKRKVLKTTVHASYSMKHFAVLYDKQIPLKRQPTASYNGHLRSNQCSMVVTQLVTYCPVPTDLSIHLLNPTDACSGVVATHWQFKFLFSMI